MCLVVFPGSTQVTIYAVEDLIKTDCMQDKLPLPFYLPSLQFGGGGEGGLMGKTGIIWRI